MVIIAVDQNLSNSALYEHRCIEHIKKLYNYTGKCDYQQQNKEIIEYAMVHCWGIYWEQYNIIWTVCACKTT